MSNPISIIQGARQPRPPVGVKHPVREGRLARLRRHARRQRLHTLSRATAYAEAAGLIALAVVVGAWIGHAF